MIKKVLVILAGILVLAVVGVVLVVSRYDFNRLKQPVADAVRQATGRRLTVGGDIHLAPGLKPALTVGDIRLANADWGSRAEMVKLERLEVQVALMPLIRGVIEVERFILIAPDILVETDAKGRSNLDFTRTADAKPEPVDARAQEIAGPADLPALALKALEIRDGRLAFRDQASGRTHHLLLKKVQAAMADLASPLAFSVAGEYEAQGFTLDGRLGPVTAVLDPAMDWAIDLQARAMDIAVELDGRIQNVIDRRGIDLNFRLQAPHLNRAAALAGLPPAQPVSMTLSGNLKDSGARIYRISDLNLNLGDSDLSGAIVVDLAGKRPRINADLSAKLIDIAALIPPARKGQGPPAAASPASSAAPRPGRLFPDTPLPLEGLNAVDGTVGLKIDQIRLPAVTASQLNATLNLSKGRLAVSPLAARIGDGKLDGDVTVTGRGKSADLALRLAVDGLDLGKILKDLKTTDALAGHVDGDVNIKARGASVAALMAGLNGHARLTMNKGRVNKGLADLTDGTIAAGLLGLIQPTVQQQAHTEINCLVVRLDAVNGLADTTVCFLDTPQIAVAGDGRIDLRTERLDIAFKPTPKQGLLSGKFGKLNISLSDLARPLKLGGTLSKPSLAVDPTQSAQTLAKALFATTGIASAQAGGSAPGEKGPDPCQAALQAAKTGRKFSAAPAPRPGTTQSPARATPLEQMGNTLIKGLFGN